MFSGHKVLIVEAEFLIAFDIQRMLEALLSGQMLFARSPEEARQHEHLWPAINLAIVEIDPHPEQSRALLDGLRQAGIPLIVSTVDASLRQGHPDFPGAPVLVKPIMEESFHHAVTTALAASPKTAGSLA